MRNLSIIGLKLLGIFCIYWAVSEFAPVAFVLIASNSTTKPHFADVWLQLVYWLLAILISVAFAFALLLRTDSIVEKLKFPEDTPSTVLEPAQILRIGFVILGSYTLIDALPAIGSTIYSAAALHSGMANGSAPDVSHIVAPALKFILGCILIGRSDFFARSVFPASRAED